MPIGKSIRTELPPAVPHERVPDEELGDFFEPSFMEEYTQFDSFEGFCLESPWGRTDGGGLEDVSTTELDRYVRQTTEFDGWTAMRNRAAEREIRDQLLL